MGTCLGSLCPPAPPPPLLCARLAAFVGHMGKTLIIYITVYIWLSNAWAFGENSRQLCILLSNRPLS